MTVPAWVGAGYPPDRYPDGMARPKEMLLGIHATLLRATEAGRRGDWRRQRARARSGLRRGVVDDELSSACMRSAPVRNGGGEWAGIALKRLAKLFVVRLGIGGSGGAPALADNGRRKAAGPRGVGTRGSEGTRIHHPNLCAPLRRGRGGGAPDRKECRRRLSSESISFWCCVRAERSAARARATGPAPLAAVVEFIML